MSTPFLTAEWRDLLIATFEVPDALLAPRVPRGLTLDRWSGSALVSLVAFDFHNTRVLGVPWPGFTHFPELNLRFYVRHGERRGVCFIREYVPARTIAWIARTLYNEPYSALPYRKDGAAHVLTRSERDWRIAWTKAGDLVVPGDRSLEHFIKEHEWGFVADRNGQTRVYRVEHPWWRIWPEVRHEPAFDFEVFYGAEWGFLNSTRPISVVAAEGSAIKVFPGLQL